MAAEKIVFVNLGQSFQTDAIRDEYYHCITDYLKEQSFYVEMVNGNEYDEGLTIRQLRDADGVIFSSNGCMKRHVMEQLPKLKLILRYGIGLDSIDLGAATELEKIVCYTPGYCSESIGVHAVALGLASLRNIPYYDKYTRQGIWLKGNGVIPAHPKNMTVGLFALGASAAVVAQAMGKGFGSKVIAYDPYAVPEKASELGVSLVSFDELLRQSDMLFIHAPLTPETRGIFDSDAFDRMKPTAILINVSRGPIVNQQALAKALAEGKLAKAALDVFEREPPSRDDPLFQNENVISTPHSAYYSRESLDNANYLVSRIPARMFKDHLLYRQNLANPAVLERLPGYKLADGPVE